MERSIPLRNRSSVVQFLVNHLHQYQLMGGKCKVPFLWSLMKRSARFPCNYIYVKFDVNEKIKVFNLQLHCSCKRSSGWGQIANSCGHQLYVFSCSLRGDRVTGEMFVTLSISTVFCGFSYLIFPYIRRSLFYDNSITFINKRL